MSQRVCSVCGACGCGTALFDVAGKLYCSTHRPNIIVGAPDAQILTPQQKLNLINGQ